ncbi:CE1759 family FMN reductase [Leucobacter sp. W1153]|uniref:CE1759 family FMN reductase n=1 Tax=unclassified Leucobacter TaxID=2621730 RepID=UPI003F2A7712
MSHPSSTPRVRLVAVSGGLGAPSSTRLLADRVISYADRALQAHGISAEVKVIELRDLAGQISNNLITGFAEPKLAEALREVREADGLIAVTPVFNGSFAGLFKSFFDLIAPDDIEGTPVALGATGGSARHSLVVEYALRPLFSYLRALPMPTGIFAATADWGATESGDAQSDGVEDRAARVGRELASAMRVSLLGSEGEPGGPETSASVALPTQSIAPTTTDFTPEARAADQGNAEHSGFAELMEKYADQSTRRETRSK